MKLWYTGFKELIALKRWNPNLERRLERFAIPNLMKYVVAGQGIVFLLTLIWPSMIGSRIYWLITLQRSAILRGEIWRLVTFIFAPPPSSVIFIVFALYFYYLIGTRLETLWGKVKFNLYYLIGMLGAILAAFLTGYADNTYLNLSLFLAYAAIWPDEEVLLFMLLPVKMKYLAALDIALYAVQFIRGGASVRVTILLSLVNLFLFVGGDLLHTIRRDSRYWKTRRNFRKTMWK